MNEKDIGLFEEEKQQEWDETNDLRMQTMDNFSEQNKDKLREIERVIVSAIIISADGKVLMGKKDPSKGGVYPNAWHIPGGGVESGQTMEEALMREVLEETGIDASSSVITQLPQVGHGESPKTLKDTGEKVWCKMEFNRFEIRLIQNADEVELKTNDDLVELKWFSKEELENVEQIPGGREFFEEAGYIKKENDQ
jgi:nucleoside triphosphatase